MFARSLLFIAGVIGALPAQAGELRPEEAKRFVGGKVFSYTCFEGTKGVGRIFADGSVQSSGQVRGTGPVRLMPFPPGTVKAQPHSICASPRGTRLSPCFTAN